MQTLKKPNMIWTPTALFIQNRTFITGANYTEIFWKKNFREIRKLLNFQDANSSTDNSRNSRRKIK